MSRTFRRTLVAVTLVHIACLMAMFGVSASHARQSEPFAPSAYLPVELISEADLAKLSQQVAPEPEHRPEQIPTDIPEPEPPKPKEKKPVKPKPVIGPLVKKPSTPIKRISSEDIRNMLRLPESGDSTSSLPPGEDTLCKSLVYRTFYDAWKQPSYADAANAVVTAKITLGTGGVVTGWSIERESGIAILDSSVRTALNSVRRIPGLTASFIADNRTLVVMFRVEE